MLVSVFELLSALNIFLSITASLGNALIFVSLHKETSLHPPTKLLFRCLVVTGLSVGVFVQPLGAVLRLFYTGSYWQNTSTLQQLHQAISFALYGVSVFTTSAISLDRFLALFSGLRYRHVVTLPRARAVIISFWLSGLSCGSMFFLNSKIAFTVAFVLIIICASKSVFSYTKIYRKLRQHQLQVHPMKQRQPHVPQVPMNSTFQEVSFQYIVGAVCSCHLLYSVYRCDNDHDMWPNTWKEIWNNFRRYSNSYLLKVAS